MNQVIIEPFHACSDPDFYDFMIFTVLVVMLKHNMDA